MKSVLLSNLSSYVICLPTYTCLMVSGVVDGSTGSKTTDRCKSSDHVVNKLPSMKDSNEMSTPASPKVEVTGVVRLDSGDTSRTAVEQLTIDDEKPQVKGNFITKYFRESK